MPIERIARTTGHGRELVRNVVRGVTGDVFRPRRSSLEVHPPWLESEWKAGCRNGAELWRRLRARGFTGRLRVVGEWATRRRRSEQVPEGAPDQVPSARRHARLLTITRDGPTKADAVVVAASRGRGAGARGSSLSRQRLPGDGSGAAACRPRWPDREGEGQPAGILRGWARGRTKGCRCCVDEAVVERADRRPDHPLEAGETADVWPCQS